jgi:hypothetical protein
MRSSDIFFSDNRNSPFTSTFNGQIFLAHLDSEESLFTPEVTPGVSTNPVFSSVFNTPTKDRDDMVDHRNQNLLGVDTASVVFELISSINTTSNGAISINSLLHSVNSLNMTVVRDLPVLVLSDSGTVSTSVSSLEAVFADLNIRASETCRVLSNIVLAGIFRNTVRLSKSVDTSSITTLAGTTSTAVNNSLDRKSDFRESGVSGDVDSISQSRSTSLSPARSAVNGNVLVLSPGDVVLSVDVSPIPGGRKIVGANMSPRELSSERFLTRVLEEISNSAALGASLGEKIFQSGVSFGLDFFSSSTLISDVVSPGVLRNTPLAFRLNTEVVSTSDNSEETAFTIVRSPGVSNKPVFDTLFNTVTNDRNSVIESISTSCIIDNTTSVVEEASSVNTADNGTSLVDFVDHSLFTINVTEFGNGVNGISGRNGALVSRPAVLALNHIIATDSSVPALSLVVRATFVGNSVVVDIFKGKSRVTTVAALVFALRAGQKNLRSQFEIGPLSLSGDLNSVSKSRGGGKGPAGTAVLGNMLVSHKSEVVDTVSVIPKPLIGSLAGSKSLEGSEDLGRELFTRNTDVSLVEGEGNSEKDG